MWRAGHSLNGGWNAKCYYCYVRDFGNIWQNCLCIYSQSSNPLSKKLMWKHASNSKKIYVHKIIFITLFTTAKYWQLPKYTNMIWESKIWCIHIMEYDAAVKKNETYLYQYGGISKTYLQVKRGKMQKYFTFSVRKKGK